MGRDTNIKHIEKNAYSNFKQVLVKIEDKETPDTTVTIASFEMSKRTKRSKTNRRPERSYAHQKPEKTQNPERPKSPKRPERFESSAEPEKLVKLVKSENNDKPEELENPVKVTKADEHQNPENVTKAEKQQNTVKVTKAERQQNPVKVTKADEHQNPVNVTKAEKQQNPVKVTKAEIHQNPEEHDKSKKVVKPDQHNKPDNIETVAEVICKHPLENAWGMWYITNDKQNWEDNLIKLTAFATVEDYWCLYHHMKPPSHLGNGKDYAVFKNDFRPMWEDPANRRGGRWVISFDKKRNETSDLDSIWMYLVLLMIGENFTVPDAICGAVVNIRAKCRIAIWVSDYKHEHNVIQVGKTIRDTLGLNGRLSFQQHNTTRSLYTL